MIGFMALRTISAFVAKLALGDGKCFDCHCVELCSYLLTQLRYWWA